MAAQLLILGALMLGVSGKLIEKLEDFEFDVNGRLKDSWLIFGEGGCASTVESGFRDVLGNVRRLGTIKPKNMRKKFFGDVHCGAIVLDKGLEREYVYTPFRPMHKYTTYSALNRWLVTVQRVEMGFLSYHKNDLEVFWQRKDENGTVVEEVSVGTLEPGEPKTMWRSAFLGHEFKLKDVVTGGTNLTFVAEYDSFNLIGRGAAPGEPPSQDVIDEDTAGLLHDSVLNSNRIKRTFTEMGFAKGRLPPQLYGSIRAFYYNNMHSTAHEDWSWTERNVNWWTAPSYMVVAPFGLKARWQDTLKDLVEEWIGGVPLENTDIYGIREYKRGARLLSHVDREQTHAASLIINVAQTNVQEDWPLEIYDHGGRLHEIIMEPGDILYYESARCIHGRMRPFRGDSFVNIFSHYRPVDDPYWYKEGNPEETPEPLVDGSKLTKKDAPWLSPSKARIAIEKENAPEEAGRDLFHWWGYVGSERGAHVHMYDGRTHDLEL